MMVQTDFPNIIILPLSDQRSNTKWSKALDDLIIIPFGPKKTVLYGSRDSFIPSYNGKYPTIELSPSIDYNGTNIRDEVAKEIVNSRDFRAGIIHSVYSRYPITYPTVDICAYNDKGQFLMAKKPNEGLWRFVGGFVDQKDDSYEISAEREFREETGGSCHVGKMKYILSQKVDDWRYQKEADGIMTTLFLTEYGFGIAKASDDIVDLEWVDIKQFSNYDGVRTKVMPEHRDMMLKLIDKIYGENLIPNLGDRLAERTDNVTYLVE
jgi:bifunctional NMN adenylyltransferase/nudix hydrolase